MKTSLKYFIALFFYIPFIIYSCKSDSDVTITSSGANTISGTVTVVDDNFGSPNVGSYKVAAFISWPPMGPPVANSNLNFVKEGNYYKASYILKNLDLSGFVSFVVAFGWRTTYGWHSPVLGVYGCDTARDCAHSIQPNVTISHDAGTTNIDFKCYSDTTKKLF